MKSIQIFQTPSPTSQGYCENRKNKYIYMNSIRGHKIVTFTITYMYILNVIVTYQDTRQTEPS